MKNRFFDSFDFRFGREILQKPSVLALLAANLFPIVGVIFLGWDVFLLLVLFWTENLVIGFYTVLKMLFSAADNSNANNSKQAPKAFMIPFFCVHYGLFTLVHGIFIFMLFGGGVASTWQQLTNGQLGWGALALLVSHGLSFYYNYIRAGEYKRSHPGTLIYQPYDRVVVLHLTIIFGGFLVMLLGSPVVGLLFLIVLKTTMDIRAHLREHAKYPA